MLWNCPHCQHAITPKTLVSTRIAEQGNRRAILCPACKGEVEMNIHSSEYWQLIIPALGLLALWGASKNGSTASMVLAAVVVGGGFVATLLLRHNTLRFWQRFRKPGSPAP